MTCSRGGRTWLGDPGREEEDARRQKCNGNTRGRRAMARALAEAAQGGGCRPLAHRTSAPTPWAQRLRIALKGTGRLSLISIRLLRTAIITDSIREWILAGSPDCSARGVFTGCSRKMKKLLGDLVAVVQATGPPAEALPFALGQLRCRRVLGTAHLGV